MTISDHAATFAGKPVEDFDSGTGLVDPKGTAYAVRGEYDGASMVDLLAALFSDPNVGELEALIIGVWPEAFDVSSTPIVEALVAAKDSLGSLKAIFLGDITYEECEISWISQSDVSPLFAAFPNLEVFKVRGGQYLSFNTPNHGKLRELIVETGGLASEAVSQIAKAHLPALEKLELWLGVDDYGGNATLDDLAPILSGKPFPKLKHLGLKNAQIADQIAQAITGAPVLAQLHTLDLSMGTMGDEGAQALLSCDALSKLECVDVSDNYVSETMLQSLRGATASLLSSEQGDPNDEWRYTTVAE